MIIIIFCKNLDFFSNLDFFGLHLCFSLLLMDKKDFKSIFDTAWLWGSSRNTNNSNTNYFFFLQFMPLLSLFESLCAVSRLEPSTPRTASERHNHSPTELPFVKFINQSNKNYLSTVS